MTNWRDQSPSLPFYMSREEADQIQRKRDREPARLSNNRRKKLIKLARAEDRLINIMMLEEADARLLRYAIG